MKKLLIGLLIIAAAAGAFFYLRNEKKPLTNGELAKEQLTGTWKLESITSPNDSIAGMIALISMINSTASNYHCEFTPGGTIIRKVNNSATTDTSLYEWKGDQLAVKENRLDTIPELFTVLTLNKDSLYFRSQDSILMLFSKSK
jgi:hypothetical protein